MRRTLCAVMRYALLGCEMLGLMRLVTLSAACRPAPCESMDMGETVGACVDDDCPRPGWYWSNTPGGRCVSFRDVATNGPTPTVGGVGPVALVALFVFNIL